MNQTEQPFDRAEDLQSFAGRRVAVLGMSVTGFSAADTLVELGAQVLAMGRGASDAHIDLLSVLGVAWHPIEHDGDEIPVLQEFSPDAIVVSPGFSPHHPAVQWAVARTVPLLTDIDLAWHLQRQRGLETKWLCVTGTNGKTTTVEMATDMLVSGGLRAAACGNIGVPILDLIREPVAYDAIVVELSSFQLYYINRISPWASICLNIAADHIDWHGSVEAYAAAKARVYENVQTACVYPVDDEQILRMVEQADVVEGARAIGVTAGAPSVGQIGIVDEVIADRAFIPNRDTHAQEITTISRLRQHGLGLRHLIADALAAIALTRSVGVQPEAIGRALDEFHTDGHRITPVGEVAQVLWIDDSKATNPHAARVALESFDSVVWIVGGMLKGIDLGPLVQREHDRLRGAVIIGADRSAVRELFSRFAPDVPTHEIDVVAAPGDVEAGAELMRQTVVAAAAMAQPDDVVLLAPASASWDQFVSYAQRGDLFASAVQGLQDQA